MSVIRDAIWEDVHIYPYEKALINCEPMQRLHYLKQLGTLYLVFPSATHSRWEHSIGCLHVADMIFEKLHKSLENESFGCTKEYCTEDKYYVRVAALLHDIGHPPFSHIFEEMHFVTDELSSLPHHGEKGVQIVQNSEIIQKILSKADFDVEKVVEILKGTMEKSPAYGILSRIVGGPLDADRFDYLKRDAYYCGISYGVIDTRVLSQVIPFRDEICVIGDWGLLPAESLLIARYLMNGIAYTHQIARITTSMLERALEAAELNPNSDMNISELLEYNDLELLLRLKKERSISGDLGKRIINRKLFKKCCGIPARSLDLRLREEFYDMAKDSHLMRELETELFDYVSKKTNLPLRKDYFVLNMPKPKTFPEASLNITYLYRNLETRRITNESRLAEQLKEAYDLNWSIQVYSEFYREAKRKILQESCEEFFRREYNISDFSFIPMVDYDDYGIPANTKSPVTRVRKKNQIDP